MLSRRAVLALVAGAWLVAACAGSPAGPGGLASPPAVGTPVTAPSAPGAPGPSTAPQANGLAGPSGEQSGAPGSLPSSSIGAGLAPTGPIEPARVVRVVDGDTIVVDRGRGEEKVRYIGVDTPETVKPGSPVEWMGPQASAENRALVEGREVVLERDVSEYDRYGRLLRYVWLQDGATWTLVNLALVAAGYAQVVTYPPDVKYVDLYLAAQREAREAGRGLWGTPSPGGEPTSSPAAVTTAPRAGSCDPAYPGVCIPPPPPDLDCRDVPYRRFTVLPPDPHRFDGDHDGVGCES